MENKNGKIRLISLIFTAVVMIVVSVSGYTEVKGKADVNELHIFDNKESIRELSNKFDKKIDSQSKDITKILLTVEYLKAKTELK